MVNYATEKSYIASVDELERRLSERKPSLDVRHVVIVPDVYTFGLEKRLMLKFGGAFDVEITTFNRLYSRVIAPETEVIGKQAAIMLLKRICREKAGELRCYSRSALRQGFGGKLYDAINRFRSCGISAEDLREAAKSDTKIADLALLYSEYEREIAGKYVDAGGRMKLLREATETRGLFGNAHVYIALYDALTTEAEKLIAAIGGNALSVTVFSAARCDGKVTDDVEVYKFPDDVREYKAVAVMIREYLLAGGNPDGVAVVDGRGETAVMRRIFDEYGIPYYVDFTVTLDKTELGRFVFTLISCASGAMRRADMISLAFNRYAGLTTEESSAFSDYVRARAVDYKGFFEPFDDGIAEKSRQKLVALTDELKNKTDRASSLAAALTSLLEKIGARETTIEIGKLDGRDYEQVYDKATGLIASFGALMKSVSDDEDDKVSDILREGFAGTEISLVPNRSGVVTAGGLAAFRGARTELGIVVGFNDGIMPSLFADDGLVADSDADKLEKYRIKITPKTEEKTELCRDELRHFLCGAKRLILSYTEQDGAKPSYDLIKLMRTKGIKSAASFALTREEQSDPLLLARFLSTRSGAYEAVMLDPEMPHAGSVLEASEGAAPKADLTHGDKLTEPIGAGQTTSVSALQTYFLCPRMYFFKYGLKVKKRDDGEVTPIDVGRLLHKIVEKYVNAKCPEDAAEFVEAELPEAVKAIEKYGYAANENSLAAVKKEATKLCDVIKKQIRIGNFVPKATEKSFGKPDSELKTVVLPCGVGLAGDIDRIDVFGDYARVIDYKTGMCGFDYKDVYYGKKIQLPVYLRILIENGYRPAGAFYFPLASAWSDDEYTHRLIGPFSVDENVLAATDPVFTDKGKSLVVAASTRVLKSGERDFYGSKRAVTETTLTKLASYAVEVANGASREIRDGYIEPTPLGDGAEACAFCDYRNACFYKGRSRGERKVGVENFAEVKDGE